MEIETSENYIEMIIEQKKIFLVLTRLLNTVRYPPASDADTGTRSTRDAQALKMWDVHT